MRKAFLVPVVLWAVVLLLPPVAAPGADAVPPDAETGSPAPPPSFADPGSGPSPAAPAVPSSAASPGTNLSPGSEAPSGTGGKAGAPAVDNVPATGKAGETAGEEAGETAEEISSPTVRDPLEPVNRAIFVFNDKAYFWVMKPIARGYGAVVPEGMRVSVRYFFRNLGAPIRFVGNLMQGKFRNSGVELLRFAMNSTIGIGGFFDPAKNDYHIEPRDEDLGRTLGVYGLGHGAYLVLPLLGPSSLRDAVGLAGDAFLDPVNYAGGWVEVSAVKAVKAENNLSLSIGDYEELKKSSLDPYIALRDAYIQHRAKKAER